MKNSTFQIIGLLKRLSRKAMARHSLGLALAALLGSVSSVQADVYGFTLVGPNTARNPATGATITLTGTGTFEDFLGVVSAKGVFTQNDAQGKVLAKGSWVATAFDSFESDGGLNNGSQGGVLKLEVTLFPKGGAPIAAGTMTVVCPFEESEDVFHEDHDGTTVGDYSEIVGGITAFHLVP
jgi:hypothetical protein